MHELLYRSEDKQARIRVSQSPVITQVQKKLQPTTLNQRGQQDFWMESFKIWKEKKRAEKKKALQAETKKKKGKAKSGNNTGLTGKTYKN